MTQISIANQVTDYREESVFSNDTNLFDNFDFWSALALLFTPYLNKTEIFWDTLLLIYGHTTPFNPDAGSKISFFESGTYVLTNALLIYGLMRNKLRMLSWLWPIVLEKCDVMWKRWLYAFKCSPTFVPPSTDPYVTVRSKRIVSVRAFEEI